MSAMSNFLENALYGHLFGGVPYAAPATLYVGLVTAPPDDALLGAEVAAGGYARVAVANSAAQWSAPVAGNGTTKNINPVAFPLPSDNWGLVTHFAIFDAPAGGNFLWYGALTVAKTINIGDVVSFQGDSITIQMDN